MARYNREDFMTALPQIEAEIASFRAQMAKELKELDDKIEQFSSGVADVLVNGTSVVTNSIASITVPTKVSQLTNDSGFITGYTETDPTVPSWAKQSTKPTYTASEVGALPASTTIPSKTSDLTNDSGFITGYTETDPTVPSWAKASSKPSYNFSEIGSKPTTLSGYGITDAKIASGTITLGSNTITPLTSFTETDPTVPSWAKASSKPSYTASEVGALASDGTAVAANFLVSTDDRSNNRAPSYYMGKGKGTYNEFKTNSTIGTNTFMSTTFCSLTTYILWNDSSGGRPVQIAVDNNGVICHRWATSDSAWSSWVRIDNTNQQANATRSGSIWTAGSINLYRRGTTCYLKINGATFSQITSRTTVATVPNAFKPYTETSGYLDGGTVQIFITADGQLRINPVAAGQRWGGIMYLAAN